MRKTMHSIPAVVLLLLAAVAVPGASAQELELQQWRPFDFTPQEIPPIRFEEPWEPPVAQGALRWASFNRQEDIRFPQPWRSLPDNVPVLRFAPFTPF